MDKRAFNVAVRFLSAQTPTGEPQESTDPKKMPTVLTDKQIVIAIDDALKSYHQAVVVNYLKRLDVPHIFIIFDNMVKSFNASGVPHKEFELLFANLKPKLIATISDLILSDKQSIKDKLLQQYKKSPPKTLDDVDTDTHEFLTELRVNAITNVKLLNRFI